MFSIPTISFSRRLVAIIAVVVIGTSATTAGASCGDYLHQANGRFQNDGGEDRQQHRIGRTVFDDSDPIRIPRRCNGPNCRQAPKQPVQTTTVTETWRLPREITTLCTDSRRRITTRFAARLVESANQLAGYPPTVDRPPRRGA